MYVDHVDLYVSFLFSSLQVAFTEHINNCLGNDPLLRELGYVPMNAESDDLFRNLSDGLVLW